jgi:hypothetical protein
MRPINDRPGDRAARRAITLCILVGAALGAVVGVPRYGSVSVGNAALMGLGVMIALAIYAGIVAITPSHRLDDEGSPDRHE